MPTWRGGFYGCVAAATPDGGAVVDCVGRTKNARLVLGPDGTPIPVPPWEWIGARLSWIGATPLGLTLVLVGLVLAWLGRVGVSLRLLSRPPFVSPEILRAADGPLVFESSDATHVVRVPRSHVLTDVEEEEVAVASELLSREPVGVLAYRTGIAELPRGAFVVVDRPAVRARRIERARTIAFRLGVLGLALMVSAALAIVLRA